LFGYLLKESKVMTDEIRLLVVDDHPVVRAGLRMLLAAQPDITVVGEATDGEMAVARALELKPDVVVMDLTMEGMDGLTATREIVSRLPETKVLALTMHSDQEYLRRTLEAGATGYLLKEAVDTEIAVAVRVVQRGEVFIYPSFTKVLLKDWVQEEQIDDRVQPDNYALLSSREKEVLRLVALGYTNREIAEQLFLSVRTVETYRARLMEKLGLKSRGELVRYALRKGLRPDELADPANKT
jgi:two-component system response regulator NreC